MSSNKYAFREIQFNYTDDEVTADTIVLVKNLTLDEALKWLFEYAAALHDVNNWYPTTECWDDGIFGIVSENEMYEAHIEYMTKDKEDEE